MESALSVEELMPIQLASAVAFSAGMVTLDGMFMTVMWRYRTENCSNFSTILLSVWVGIAAVAVTLARSSGADFQAHEIAQEKRFCIRGLRAFRELGSSVFSSNWFGFAHNFECGRVGFGKILKCLAFCDTLFD